MFPLRIVRGGVVLGTVQPDLTQYCYIAHLSSLQLISGNILRCLPGLIAFIRSNPECLIFGIYFTARRSDGGVKRHSPQIVTSYLSFWPARFHSTLPTPPLPNSHNVLRSFPLHAKFCTRKFTCTLTNGVPSSSSTSTPFPVAVTTYPFCATLIPSGTQSGER